MSAATEGRNVPNDGEMESLFVNNEKLQRIHSYLNRFNPIRTMRMDGMEIRHSYILAWLMDPNETHGFGDRFLKAFLAEALRGHSGIGEPTALKVSQCDLRDAEVRREWKNIDIYVYSQKNQWAFVIENKYYASQYDGQLSKYINNVKLNFDTRNESPVIRGIFLTLLDEEPQDSSYVPIGYAAVCKLLKRLLEQEGQVVSQEAAMFLRHYLEIIEDETGMSGKHDEMAKLARELYRDHRKTLDFVMEHGAAADFVVAAETLFKNTKHGEISSIDEHQYKFFWHNNSYCCFLPVTWAEAFDKRQFSWPGCEDWWEGYPLICWFQLVKWGDNVKGDVRLYAEVGPLSKYEFRRSLLEGIRDVSARKGLKNIGFRDGATKSRFGKWVMGVSHV